MIKIGHRGAAGYMPENTIASFKKAIELGTDMIEFDVHICKSGELVVIHDEKVNRTMNGKGKVNEMTLSELKKLDIIGGGEISTLEEILDFVDKKVKVNIEIKSEGIFDKVCLIIEKYIKEKGWKYGYFLVSSFDLDQIEKLKKCNKKIKIGMLFSRFSIKAKKLIEVNGIYSVNLNWKYLNKDDADYIHEKGLKVFVWTVNDISDIKRMKSMRVDGIMSDFPDRI